LVSLESADADISENVASISAGEFACGLAEDETRGVREALMI
jgi:hypothetical protein